MKFDANILKACFFLFRFIYGGFVWCQFVLHLRQLKFKNFLITTSYMDWLGQLILDETDFDRILWTLEIISLFDEAVSCPVLRTNFSSSSFVLLDTTWASSTVVFTSWGSVDLMRTESLRDYLKLPGATDRDWASLGISIMALPSCLGNIWASANGAAWGSFEVDGLPPGDHLLRQRSHPRLLCFKLWSAEGQVVSLSL